MTNAIEVQNVTKKYDGFVLDDINFTLPRGCIMGLVGENGAGKSTTIKLILGLIKGDAGKALVLGADAQNNVNIREDIGVVLDSALGIPPSLSVKQVEKILKNIYKNWDSDAFRGYLTRFSIPEKRRFSELSRGMKMKLEIAIALSHGAKLLILDEATSGLDPVVRDEILDIFMDFTREEDHSILISSHIVSDLEKVCDYIAFLHEGKLVLCEEKDALCERYGMIHCTTEAYLDIDEKAVLGKKQTPYGIEAIVDRALIPHDMETEKVNLEDIFVYMIRRKV